MRRLGWEVNEEGVRPAGPPDACFYCGKKKGAEHGHDCVIRKRTVVTRITLDLVQLVPEGWEEEQINFYLNDPVWCLENLREEIERALSNKHACSCKIMEGKYQREAEEEDEENFKIFVEDCKS